MSDLTTLTMPVSAKALILGLDLEYSQILRAMKETAADIYSDDDALGARVVALLETAAKEMEAIEELQGKETFEVRFADEDELDAADPTDDSLDD